MFVADVENIGTIGDAFDIGPTQLDLDESQDPQEDAGRKLLNRLNLVQTPHYIFHLYLVAQKR